MTVRIIGIGASAGGLQALEEFFSEVPVGLGVAFIVVQHLSMDHASSMSSILQRTTSLRVVPLDSLVVPEPDTVYVKMPGVDVEVDKMTIRTVARNATKNALYLPIDDFFFSLAKSRGEDAIAIVLSGMGADGSRGLKEVKSRGGLVMVQHPGSAQFDGMPRAALRQHLADIVLPPAELASRLATMLRHSTALDPENDVLHNLTQSDLVRKLLDRIYQTARLDFNRYRPATIMRRIEKRMLIRQHADLAQYVQQTLEDEEELQTLRQSFLIGVTRFFRDQDAFDVLKQEVIPSLFDQVGEREVRIWVPACSTGEEAYSIAILIQDYLDSNGLERTFKIFGSDVDRKSIITAAAGVYDESIAADVPAPWLQKYFIREPPGFRVRPDLKENILFAVQNLLDDPPFIRIDFLSCRNFLIYVNGEGQQRILANFHFSLNPSGCLMLGPSESLGGLQSAFTTVDRRWKIYRKRMGGKTPARRGGHIIDHSSSLTEGENTPAVPQLSQRLADSSTGAFKRSNPSSLASMDFYARYLSERYAPATLFVNRQYDILYLNGDFDGMLRLPRFNAMLSLHTMVSQEAQSLLTAGVDRVLRTGNSGVFERINLADTGNTPNYVRVRFSVTEFAQVDEPVAMLEFFPSEEQLKFGAEIEGDEVYSVDSRLRERIRRLEAELLSSEQRGQKLYNELEATNEELQSSNRELLASNEEMQSTNEELQSVNEELYTVNNEFQRKNEELNNINNDVHNLLKSTQISTIFVDDQLRIRRFTPGVGQQFDLHTSDLGRPITSFSNPFEELDFEALCRKVLTSTVRHDQEIQDRKGNYFLLRMLPYLTDQEHVQGIVITFVDINDLVFTRHRLTDMANKYEAIFENTEETIAVLWENSRIEEVNRPLAGRQKAELVGTYFTDLIVSDQDKVRFNEGLRASFDRGEVSNQELSLKSSAGSTIYTKLEIIPIAPTVENTAEKMGRVSQVMVIIHDFTEIEEERQQSTAIISKYVEALSQLQQDAGLVDMQDRLINVNHMRGHIHEPDHYLNRMISDFITPSGMEKYRLAVDRIRGGSEVEKVTFSLQELLDDNQPRTVLYRPVFINGVLTFINFETVD
ncbi:two-component system CheB/CheR fusion protein [Neolewinella xylanilytica]|uniref:Two-component system CheB/CheR fusion protein n=1 Tax=Neolewinella xylanilytica TaxID=1514080 RepID=A0A2S6I3U8_9BACT|nr:CheR family methyltransferase [Neolewinella xylanilytica]PPK85835.1 two-component system CheB/CheR fusion protein [Neolewinella xylanilytica]